MAPDNPQSVVGRYFAATRAMDLEAWIACFAENAISHEPAAPVPLQGHTALRQFFQGLAGAFQKVGLTEDHVFVTGNKVAVKFTGRGIGKNGREVVFEGIDVFEINDRGTIQTMWGYWNPAAMMAQLQ
jgi:steroid delta-isomerase